MKKLIDNAKRVKLIATIFDPAHDEDEDWEEREIEITIPNYELSRLIEEGMFSIYFENVIEGYRKWIEEISRLKCSIAFQEIK